MELILSLLALIGAVLLFVGFVSTVREIEDRGLTTCEYRQHYINWRDEVSTVVLYAALWMSPGLAVLIAVICVVREVGV